MADVKLSLEPPYRNDDGLPLPVVLDIQPGGEYVYEDVETPAAKLANDLRRIFQERGTDFFTKRPSDRTLPDPTQPTDAEAKPEEENDDSQPMTTEELLKMRSEIIPQLYWAMSEMNRAKEVLSLFLSSASASGNSIGFNASTLVQPTLSNAPAPAAASQLNQPPALPTDFLMASAISKPPQPLSFQSVDDMIVVGGKDAALRKASQIFKNAADTVERSRLSSEQYWINALKLRRQNWALLPAPLPHGAPTGRSTDKTTKDFLVFYGLSESIPVFKRNALAHLPMVDPDSGPVIFQQSPNLYLKVSLTIKQSDGEETTSHSTPPELAGETADDILREAQRRVIEQEIFGILVNETGTLSYASSRVTERLIELEASQDIQLRIELLDKKLMNTSDSHDHSGPDQARCDLIYHMLFVLLLRTQTYYKERRLARLRNTQALPGPRLLRPIVDLLQYGSFCLRIRTEMELVVNSLHKVGVPTKFHFRSVGESCEEVLSSLLAIENRNPIGGDVIIRVDNSRSMRFTFHAPSTLTAHLSQATLAISSIPQLVQLLRDETEQCLLERICSIGNSLTEDANGTWFVDSLMSRAVGKWEGHLLNFKVAYGDDSSIHCAVSHLQRQNGRTEPKSQVYADNEATLFEWLRRVIREIMAPQH